MRHLLALASMLALTAPASMAAAQKDKPRYEDWERGRFKAAQQLYDHGKFPEALSAFNEIVSVGKSPNARLYVARCLRELGKLTDAYNEMTLTLRDATERAEREPRYAQTREAAAAERAAIALKIGLLTIALTDRPAGLSITVGRDVIDPSRLGEAVPIAPGAVVVTVWAPGRQGVRRELSIGAGAAETLALNLPMAAKEVVKEETAPPDAPRAQTGGGVRTLGFVTAGLGVAGWGTFAVAGLLANSKYASVSGACGGARCTDPAYAEQIRAGRTLDTVANIGLVTGIAGVAGGALMILLGGPRDKQVIVTPSPEGAWVGYRARF